MARLVLKGLKGTTEANDATDRQMRTSNQKRIWPVHEKDVESSLTQLYCVTLLIMLSYVIPVGSLPFPLESLTIIVCSQLHVCATIGDDRETFSYLY